MAATCLVFDILNIYLPMFLEQQYKCLRREQVLWSLQKKKKIGRKIKVVKIFFSCCFWFIYFSSSFAHQSPMRLNVCSESNSVKLLLICFEYVSVSSCASNALRQMFLFLFFVFYYRNSNAVLKKMKLLFSFNSMYYRYNFRNRCAFLHNIGNTKLAKTWQI